MIRIDASELQALISESWLARAKKSTDNNRVAADYKDKGPSWSEIKPQYIKIQNGKCAYCEKPLGNEDLGAVDMEHYRPKNSIKAWPSKRIRKERKIGYMLPKHSSDRGYYLLTHNLWNYVASCKKCNSLKSDFFPTKGRPFLQNDDPLSTNSEEPYLLYPLGDHDVNPEELFQFEGVLPVIITTNADEKIRAKVTLDFFDLSSRDPLTEQRAGVIDHLWHALFVAQSSQATQNQRAMAQESVMIAIHSSSAHANCARSFRNLYLNDIDSAERIYIEAHKIHTKSLRRTS